MKRFASICLVSLVSILFLFSVVPFLPCQLAYAEDCPEQVIHTATPNGLTERWQIICPNVKQRETIYSKIKFMAGERIFIQADGCVQTGGTGKTWKHYVNPRGPSALRYYFGLIRINGLTNGLEPISKRYKKEWQLPLNATLSLGYSDDNYRDNGYYDHDDGIDNQCKGIEWAWVEIWRTNLAYRMDSFVNKNFTIVYPANGSEINCAQTTCKPLMLKWTYKNLPATYRTVKITVKELDVVTPRVISGIPLGQNGNGQYALYNLRSFGENMEPIHYTITLQTEQAPTLSSQIDMNLKSRSTSRAAYSCTAKCTKEEKDFHICGCHW